MGGSFVAYVMCRVKASRLGRANSDVELASVRRASLVKRRTRVNLGALAQRSQGVAFAPSSAMCDADVGNGVLRKA